MGPDEFHESYHDADEGGLKDNTYTNIMVAWAMARAGDIIDVLAEEDLLRIQENLQLSDWEIKHWQQISKKLNIVIDDNILAQYDGYFDLKELDWEHYRQKYGNVYRMDRLLKAEGKSADEFKVAKQADTLQTFYNLPESEVTDILSTLGYQMGKDYLKENLRYYLQRTSHGSTLSRVVHTQLANMIGDVDLSWELYLDALTSDFNDVQGGTTGEGIHAGVMAGTVLVALQAYAGVDVRSGIVKINPQLPAHWREMSFNFLLRNNQFFLKVSRSNIDIYYEGISTEIEIEVQGAKHMLTLNTTLTIDLQ